jgi:hypothetical protein
MVFIIGPTNQPLKSFHMKGDSSRIASFKRVVEEYITLKNGGNINKISVILSK